MNIILREEKGLPLTHLELDNNFLISTPISTIISIAGTIIPEGWLECDGSELSREIYIKLFNAIGIIYGAGDGVDTFNIPDLRGEFIRGWDNGKGVDSGREVGSSQGHLFASHNHVLPRRNAGGSGGLNVACGDPVNGSHGQTYSTGGTETRPRNISMMFCIKY